MLLQKLLLFVHVLCTLMLCVLLKCAIAVFTDDVYYIVYDDAACVVNVCCFKFVIVRS